MPEAISVRDLAATLATAPNSLQLVDVREAVELAIAALPGCIHLPLSESERWSPHIHEYLDPDRDIYVICHHGIRSLQMCHWLQSRGFERVKNVTGGIDAYARAVDNSIPCY